MKAIILAAGRGSRLKHLTDDRPKGLTLFRGRTLLEWQLSALVRSGIEDVGIVTGYMREEFSKYGLHEFQNKRWANTQMVASLKCAEHWLNQDKCLVIYSDIYFLHSALLSLARCTSDLSITYDKFWLDLWRRRFKDPLVDAECFRLRSNGILKEIGGRPNRLEDVQGQYMGLLCFTPAGWKVFDRIYSSLDSARQDQVSMTEVLQLIIDEGKLDILAVPYEDEWGEFDHPSDFDALR